MASFYAAVCGRFSSELQPKKNSAPELHSIRSLIRICNKAGTVSEDKIWQKKGNDGRRVWLRSCVRMFWFRWPNQFSNSFCECCLESENHHKVKHLFSSLSLFPQQAVSGFCFSLSVCDSQKRQLKMVSERITRKAHHTKQIYLRNGCALFSGNWSESEENRQTCTTGTNCRPISTGTVQIICRCTACECSFIDK